MKILASILLLAGAAFAGIAEDKAKIGTIARSVIPTNMAPKEYIGAFQQLAVAFEDRAAAKELNADLKTPELAHGLRALLSDVERAMWVFYDDKETLSYLRLLSSRIKSSM
ncbi:hypothetical protein GGI04_004157 [Coemansia thaxteri]|uniref:Uncharacterized protein n=1 Tax=Coemansia thaxteri TaxID=2663907 RepID=A0A9W8BH11_9FUNG|nr:hypothetical protein GGI04_004157 [Coemansia thaxteri]KAJ2001677.1 hypothetical protein H4R26_004000 [Coemansia thaxteri]KAJ2467208.1 hypothetical protein GGI02_004112 [Coemansia sp. RSA 2322]KAJ2477370.1 hypothetical protein EV174_004645 [Coemansia sp. RSA 2320]